MDALPIVKTLLDEPYDVRHGLRRLIRIRFKCERALRGFEDNHWNRLRRPRCQLRGIKRRACEGECQGEGRSTIHAVAPAAVAGRRDTFVTPMRRHMSVSTHSEHRG